MLTERKYGRASVDSDCSTCVKADVCQYKDKVIEDVRALKSVSLSSKNLKVVIQCSNYMEKYDPEECYRRGDS